MSNIIFLNGCSSAGKTSIARSIQHLSDIPWLLLGVDSFEAMMPDKYVGFGEKAREGFYAFIPDQNERGPLVKIESGPLGEIFFPKVAKFTDFLASEGNNLILDEVLMGDEMLRSYVKHLSAHKVYFIQVLCSLKAMQEREFLRRDRALGLANYQLDKVHAPTRHYDLTVDTTHHSAFDCASLILEYLQQEPNPQGFKTLYTKFEV